jgi:hypothetical protein
MKRVTIGLCAATVPSAGSAALAAECETVIWCDNFDNYDEGILVGQDCATAGCPEDTAGCPAGLSWQAWGFSAPNGLSPVVSSRSNSAPQSVEIVGGTGSGGAGSDDMVHTYRNLDFSSGVFQYTGMCYVPGDTTGDSYFILLNTYDGATQTYNWSTQVHFDTANGLILSDFDDGVQNEVALVTDQWVEMNVIINMDLDDQIISYNGEVVIRKSWSAGTGGAGIVDLQALDLYGNDATAVYWDDLRICTVAPEGACCFDDGSCTDGIVEATCLETDYAVFEGIGSSCAAVDCPVRGENGWLLDAADYPGGPGISVEYSGDTCQGDYPARFDCDETGGAAPDEQFEVTAAWAGTYTFGMCGASFDAILTVGTSACDLDLGLTEPGQTCEVDVDLTDSQLVFVTIDGLGGSSDCGPFDLTITTRCLDIDRDPNAIWNDNCEEQPSEDGVCYDGDTDPCNLGCNADPGLETFSTIDADGTYAGTVGNFILDGAGRRDLDWYKVELAETTSLELSLIGQGPSFVLFWGTLDEVEGAECTDNTILVTDTTSGCQTTAAISVVDAAPGWYTIIAAHDFADPDDIPCGQMSYYELTVSGLGGGGQCSELEGDIDNNGCVDFADINKILPAWNCTGDPCNGDTPFECLDQDNSGTVDFGDINKVLSNWGDGCKK